MNNTLTKLSKVFTTIPTSMKCPFCRTNLEKENEISYCPNNGVESSAYEKHSVSLTIPAIKEFKQRLIL